MGLALNYHLPFNKSKWAIVLEPSYQNFQFENNYFNINAGGDGKLKSNIDYKSMEILLAIKYNIFLGSRSKLFISAGGVLNESFNSTLIFKRSDDSLFESYELENSANMAISVGYTFVDRYAFEFRYQTKRGLNQIIALDNRATYQSFSATVGYTIFR